ncbi:Rha family transcriptional regulator [Campylobacter jejuni]
MGDINAININNQKVSFENKNNQIFCTSIDVAKVFGKKHFHVLRDIKNILNDLREIGDFKCQSNFGLVKYKDLKGELRTSYQISRDGFSLLAMRFTGKRSLRFKIAFINAFNEMEKLLRNEIKSPNKYLTDLMEIIYPKLPKNDYKVSVIITDNPYSKEAKNIFSLNYLVDNRTPKDPKKLQ